MKILHYLSGFLNGGIETLLTNIVNRQASEGNEVAIMILTNKWSQEMIDALDSRVRLFYVNKPVGSKNPLYMFKMLYYYKRFNADILHLHDPNFAKYFTPKNKTERRVVTIHNETIAMPFSKSVDLYIAISQCVLDAFKAKTGHDNCVICYNGIDFSRFKRRTDYADKPHRILAVGRILFDVKAQDQIVEAISKLPAVIRKEIHLDIWGDGKDAEALNLLVKELKVEDCVTLCGNVTNDYVADNLCNYDLLLCASHHEGLGITAIEGMAAGVPLLLSDALGYLEVTENGKYGMHFKHSDTYSMRDAIIASYNNYKSMCEKAVEAVKYSENKFSIIGYVKQILEIYNSARYDLM